ncbi:alpha/beta hydrolase [Kribbella sp. NPDC004138]
MHSIRKFTRAVAGALAAGLLVLTAASVSSATAEASTQYRIVKPTIVLVHGAWANESSWDSVTARLRALGYPVDVVPNPLRGVASDSAYLADHLATLSGPIVLVGHSYAGILITKAATGNKNVKALVYIDAYIPDQGDTLNQLTRAKDGSALAVDDPRTVFDIVPINGGTNYDLYVKKDLFPQIFAGGIPAAKAAELAEAQHPLVASALDEAVTGVPAWKTIPSWDLIGTEDQVIPPAEQRIMAARAGAHVVQFKAPHLSMVYRPAVVTDLVVTAATLTACR